MFEGPESGVTGPGAFAVLVRGTSDADGVLMFRNE